MAIRRQRRRLVCSSVPKQLSSDSTLISLFLRSGSRRRLSSVYPFRWTTDASTVCSEDAGRERRSGIIFDSFVSCVGKEDIPARPLSHIGWRDRKMPATQGSTERVVKDVLSLHTDKKVRRRRWRRISHIAPSAPFEAAFPFNSALLRIRGRPGNNSDTAAIYC